MQAVLWTKSQLLEADNLNPEYKKKKKKYKYLKLPNVLDWDPPLGNRTFLKILSSA